MEFATLHKNGLWTDVFVSLDIIDISTNVELVPGVPPLAQTGPHASASVRRPFISHKPIFVSNAVEMHSLTQPEQDVNVKQVLDQNRESAYPLKTVNSMSNSSMEFANVNMDGEDSAQFVLKCVEGINIGMVKHVFAIKAMLLLTMSADLALHNR